MRVWADSAVSVVDAERVAEATMPLRLPSVRGSAPSMSARERRPARFVFTVPAESWSFPCALVSRRVAPDAATVVCVTEDVTETTA